MGGREPFSVWTNISFFVAFVSSKNTHNEFRVENGERSETSVHMECVASFSMF